MPYNSDELGYEAKALHGCGALKEMLDQIGRNAEEKPDQRVAKIMVDNELPLLALLTFAHDALREKL